MTQSSELAGGAGFSFEDAVAVTYVAALLGEGFAPGVENRIVSRIALQQRDAGEPLDDLIVDFGASPGDDARLSLQVKRSLTISQAKTNTDFREIVRDSWQTLRKHDFRKDIDRFGAAVGEVASGKARDLRFICELSRSCTTGIEFEARFSEAGNASAAMASVKADVVALMEEAAGGPVPTEDVHQFFAHFVLIKFDFLHEGGTSYPDALNVLRSCLATRHGSQAAALWTLIARMVREGAGRSAIFDRCSIVRLLSTSVHLSAAASLRADLDQITRLTGQWLQDIGDDVGGVKIERSDLASEFETAIATSRIVQIRGLPGSGKSVLLRHRAEDELTNGPVLLLKSGRLQGNGWAGFAQANGLSPAPLADLLVEIAAVGSSTLYIDGIDRVEKKQRTIILDVIRTVLEVPMLDNWRIVVSLRDSGIEPLRNWLGDVLDGAGVGTLQVKALSDEEAELLASDKPHLRGLLFGSSEVREIVRRPFFAKVLDQNFGSVARNDAFAPQSEIDLIDNWWLRGGYNAEGQEALARQRAIVELGSIRTLHLDRQIAFRDLSPSTVSIVDDFVEDGILQHVQAGHTVRFSHDIFFEWAFFQVLADRDDAWLDEIRACGEPPAVARVVELLSQSQYGDGIRWSQSLSRVEGSQMRSQWMRSWLLAPILAPNFNAAQATFSDAVRANECRRLRKALVWFQAERTTPNPEILKRDLPQDQRIRMADRLGWPSDFAAWARFIRFLLDNSPSVPVELIPNIVSIFDVWQNAFGGWRNAISDGLLDQAWVWLKEIGESSLADRPRGESSRWAALGRNLGDLREQLVTLLLRSSSSRPDLAEGYIDLVLAADRVRDDWYGEIILFSPILANNLPDRLVDLSLRHFAEELPQDRLDREREETRRQAEVRRQALAKRPEDRSRVEQIAAEGMFAQIGFNSFSYQEWESLSVAQDTSNSWPPSPLREPFNSLFHEAPTEALRLLANLSNHAMTAWRQLHQLDLDRRSTPFPIDIDFPWASQRFWGGDREYLWHRGMWAPSALANGYLALEEWTLREFAKGRSADELVQQIVSGNECIAVLGSAVTIALESEATTPAILSLITSQRLLSSDYHRWAHDITDKTSSLIGFTQKRDLPHVEALRAANDRAFRTRELKSLIPRFFLTSGVEMSGQIQTAVLGFTDQLPFQTDLQASDPEARENLMRKAKEYAELVDIENYRQVQTHEEDRVAVVHVSPTLTSPQSTAQAEEAGVRIQEANLWAWASKYFESAEITGGFTIRSAPELARIVDNPSLYETYAVSDDGINMRRGAVAATAAVLLNHRCEVSNDDMSWAREVLRRASRCAEKKDRFWSSASILPWHPSIFVAHGWAAEVRAGTVDKRVSCDLLALAAHSMEVVSIAALKDIFSLWDLDPKLSWSALHLALTLCEFETRQRQSPDRAIHRDEIVRGAVETAFRHYEDKSWWPDLPIPPPAWERVDGNSPGARDWVGINQFTEEDVVDQTEQWEPSPVHFYSAYASKVIDLVPYEAILVHNAGDEFLSFLSAHLSWTISKISPPWIKTNRGRASSDGMYEWTNRFGRLLGLIAGRRGLKYVKREFLDPIFELDDDRCWSLLAPFVDSYICCHVYDAETVPSDAAQLLELCLERVLQDSTFDSQTHRAGELTGIDMPKLAESLMFISVEHAALAKRFANGDWTDIQLIVPIVDRYIRAAGWSSTIMSFFLTFCERTASDYPAEQFVDQVLAVLERPTIELTGWHGTLLPARISGLVQRYADRETPMPRELAQKCLRILDLMVDMGDRRSAALQLSDTFREIQTS